MDALEVRDADAKCFSVGFYLLEAFPSFLFFFDCWDDIGIMEEVAIDNLN